MKRSIQVFLVRGAIGGAIGGFFWVWFLPQFKHQDAYTQYARLLVILFVVPVALVIGMIIGWIVAALYAKHKKNYGVLMRVSIGVAFSLAATSIIWAIMNIIRTSQQPIAWNVTYWLWFVIMVGVPAGVMVGNQSAPH